MKTIFPGYYRPTDEEFNQMWQECIFAFDANILLNIYRYKPETQERFFIILECLKDRIWIPHQAAIEFYNNREERIEKQIKAYDEINGLLDEAYKKLESQLAVYLRHISVKIEQVLHLIKSGINKARESLENDRKTHPDLSVNDPLRDRIAELFADKVGSPFDNKRLSEIYSEAEQRFSVKQPPGYNDAKKPIPERYGDVVLWYQVIEHAKTEQKPLILVTDDRKEDWWSKKEGKTVSPKPELTNEIQTKAGINFYMYHSEQFIKYAQEFCGLEDQEAVVHEVEEIGKQDEVYQNVIDSLESQSSINQKAFENAKQFDSPLMRHAIEAAKSFDNPTMRHAVETARQLDNPLIRQAIENAAKFDDPKIRQAIEAARTFDNSAIRQAMEMARFWQSSPLSGQSISQDINVNISPKRLSELEGIENPKDVDVKVEVLQHSESNDFTEDETVESIDDSDRIVATQPYELDNYSLDVTLVHSPNSSHSFETSHRVRKPMVDEWAEWGLNIERTRRYYSLAEIAEHNANKAEGDEEATEIWTHTYWEWEASEKLYNKIILEIAGIKLDEADEFPTDKFRSLAPEIIEKLRIGTKVAVITKLYRCYCDVEKSVSSDSDEKRIVQNLTHNSSSFDVIHTLRKPTEDESYAFRTNIVKGYFSTNEDNQEIIQLKLNLPTAVEFYNKLIINIENATVGGQTFSDQTRDAFLEAVNPVYKLRVLEPLFNVNAWYFKIDDWKFP